ncbi:hypothetical protein BG011_003362 [Mortierella polycephala]|uniref:Galactose oxidase n=1 Tax=Mortierella polycephala TaxID=41804 RepID=A0A9P6U418_9FUNG|nr:hypothetical protein BG011_003362 [Mortierella polycephala]
MPTPIAGQGPTVFKPIANCASAILADGYLYIYGGTTAFGVTLNTKSNQFLRVDLTKDFSTLTPNWVSLRGYRSYTAITAVSSRSGEQFIIGGNRDNNGKLAHIYDVKSDQWIPTPDIPGVPDYMAEYKRGNVGMSIDPNSGMIYIYGGFQWMGFSRELSVLNSAYDEPHKMDWKLSLNQTMIPQLYSPFVHYLPTIKMTLVFGGCDGYNGLTGFVGNCISMVNGYLIPDLSNTDTVVIQKQAMKLTRVGPTPRYQSCSVVMDDGNIFFQGGKGISNFFNDAYVLDVATWTWQDIELKGADNTTLLRAGHGCQKGPNGQILVIGGFVGRNGTDVHVTPQMAVIDTKTWTWSTQYKGAPLSSIWTAPPPLPGSGGPGGNNGNGNGDGDGGANTKESSGLSSGAKGGIGGGVAIGILGLGLFFWKRKNRNNTDKLPSGTTPSGAPVKPGNGPTGNSNGNNNGANNDFTMHTAGQGYVSRPEPVRAENSMYHTAVSHSTERLTGAGGVPDTAAPGSTSPFSSPITLSTLPLYSGPIADEKAPFESATYVEHPILGQKSSGKFGLFSSPKPGSRVVNDAMLAASLLQAEDQVSSRQSPKTSHADQFPLQPQQQAVYHSQMPSTAYAKPQSGFPVTMAVSDAKSNGNNSPQSIMTSLTMEQPGYASSSPSSGRNPTLYTPVTNTIVAPVIPARPIQGPQSVPEHEARIERSSPGIKTHFVNTWDMDKNGHYTPLTPTREHGANSVLIGTPAAHIPSTAASFSAATASVQHSPGENMGSNYINVASEHGSPQGQQPRYPGAPHSTPFYQDPRVLKDAENIAKMIETQAQTEPKNPHTIVGSSRGQ